MTEQSEHGGNHWVYSCSDATLPIRGYLIGADIIRSLIKKRNSLNIRLVVFSHHLKREAPLAASNVPPVI